MDVHQNHVFYRMFAINLLVMSVGYEWKYHEQLQECVYLMTIERLTILDVNMQTTGRVVTHQYTQSIWMGFDNVQHAEDNEWLGKREVTTEESYFNPIIAYWLMEGKQHTVNMTVNGSTAFWCTSMWNKSALCEVLN